MSQLQRSVSWFTVVGAAAAITHYAVAVSLEAVLHLLPAWANVCGFLCGFPVSYLGHKHLSFAHRKSQHSQALPRFFIVACGGFVANQLLLLGALHMTALPFWLALGVVMLIVAVSSYLLGREWAFNA